MNTRRFPAVHGNCCAEVVLGISKVAPFLTMTNLQPAPIDMGTDARTPVNGPLGSVREGQASNTGRNDEDAVSVYVSRAGCDN